MKLTGQVIRKCSGGDWEIKTDGPPYLSVLFLRPCECFTGIRTGMTVRLEYRKSPTSGLWYAVEQICPSCGGDIVVNGDYVTCSQWSTGGGGGCEYLDYYAMFIRMNYGGDSYEIKTT